MDYIFNCFVVVVVLFSIGHFQEDMVSSYDCYLLKSSKEHISSGMSGHFD